MIKKEIAEKLFKAELKQEKVELALVDMFISEVDEAAKKSDIAIDEVIKVKKDLVQAEQKLKSVLSSLKTLKGGAARIRKMFAELGTTIDPKVESAIKKRTNVEFEAEELVKKINKLVSMI
jgi:predicted  nucleic acid-binding Zn-ribbon protein